VTTDTNKHTFVSDNMTVLLENTADMVGTCILPEVFQQIQCVKSFAAHRGISRNTDSVITEIIISL
jgi:hypothetical protein